MWNLNVLLFQPCGLRHSGGHIGRQPASECQVHLLIRWVREVLYRSGISGTGCHLGLLWSGSLAGADCPDRLVGNHHLAPVGHILGNCCQLAEADLDA